MLVVKNRERKVCFWIFFFFYGFEMRKVKKIKEKRIDACSEKKEKFVY